MANYLKYTDLELLNAFKNGERSAFSHIYKRYFGLLYRHAFQMLKDKMLAEDVLHDVFQMLIEKQDEIELQHSLKAFLYASIRFRILKQFRHNKVVETYFANFQGLNKESIESVDLYMEEKELARRIEEGLSRLPGKMRKIFELSRINELSYAEISDELGITVHTVKKQINNANKILKKVSKGNIAILVL